jgi:hypothetical protein
MLTSLKLEYYYIDVENNCTDNLNNYCYATSDVIKDFKLGFTKVSN